MKHPMELKHRSWNHLKNGGKQRKIRAAIDYNIIGICSGTSTEWLFVHWILDRIRIWKCWVLRRGKNQSTQRNTSRSREENQQQTQPTCCVEPGNPFRATSVGGECSHHCAIPAPQTTTAIITISNFVSNIWNCGTITSHNQWKAVWSTSGKTLKNTTTKDN